jgi:dTDP-4-dehydrorhamnose 3,5-epimerase
VKITAGGIDGMLVIEPATHIDQRGFFLESYSQRRFDELLGAETRFVQDSHSRSRRGVLRGLHYQLPPHAQGKLVRVTCGEVFDVAVDLRRRSPTFGRWTGVSISESNRRMVWLPPGLAHGFLVVSDLADFLYKTTDYHAPEAERRIRWNDPAIGIAWPDLGEPPTLVERDAHAPLLADSPGFD